MTREAGISRGILHKLNAMDGVKAIKVHGSPMMEIGTPDIHATVRGRSVWLETKTATGKAAKIQKARLRQWANAGAVTAVTLSIAEAVTVVEAVLREVELYVDGDL